MNELRVFQSVLSRRGDAGSDRRGCRSMVGKGGSLAYRLGYRKCDAIVRIRTLPYLAVIGLVFVAVFYGVKALGFGCAMR